MLPSLRFLATVFCIYLSLAAAATAQPPAIRLRVLSYNIHHGEGTDGNLDLGRIARIIRGAEADVVALQEVDRQAQRSGGVAQAAELGRLTGMRVVFGENIPLQGGGYGNALLSDLPIFKQQNHKLPRLDDGEQRGLLEVELGLPESSGSLLVLATHFDHRRPDEERLASVEAIESIVGQRQHHPLLLVGDLNASWDSAVLTTLDKTWRRPNPNPLPTFPSSEPTRQIDYILVRPATRWKLIEMKVLEEPIASDHRPLLATLELLPAATPK